jgi:hypothetical protein
VLAALVVGLAIIPRFSGMARPTVPSAVANAERSKEHDHAPAGREFENPTGTNPQSQSTDRVAPTFDATPLEPIVTREVAKNQSDQRRGLDPRHDGWETEVVVEQTKSQLRRILAELHRPATFDRDRVMSVLPSLATADLASSPLRPAQLQRVYHDGMLEVWRPGPGATSGDRASLPGPAGLAQALGELAHTFALADEVQSELHVNAVTLQADIAATKVGLHFVSHGERQTKQISTMWECLWSLQPNQLPRLSAVRVVDYEEVVTLPGRGPWFTDCTSAVLQQNDSFRQQLLPGLDHWLQRVERSHTMHAFAATGLAVGDVNGDMMDDLYVCQPGGLPNRLYVRNEDGTASDVSQLAGVDWLDHTSAALFIDLDNDGDQDLVLATLAGVLVMANDSAGRFARSAVLPTAGADTQSLSAADYDLDGDVDLYVCMNFPKVTAESMQSKTPFVYHDARDGAPNRLFRNDTRPGGKWSFTDVTVSTGLDVDNRRHSLAASWEDYDNNGDQDLYVANDYGPNCLYINDGGKFTNVAERLGVVDFGSGMSVSWSDYDRDGWMDLYVGNMFSSAGSRITPLTRFRPGADRRTRELLRRFAKGNSLFRNLGGQRFQEVGAEAGVEMARWAWSSLFIDIDNNGWEDLFVANGYITTDDTGDL